MRLAWLDPQLERCMVVGARLRLLAGDQAEAAEDLLSIVVRAPQLSAISTFRSVRLGVAAGRLTLSVEEIEMHARPLSTDGTPNRFEAQDLVASRGSSEALLMEDLRVRGVSILHKVSKYAAS